LPEVSRDEFLGKTFSDGTKLPLVVYPSRDRYRWYKT
jgi:hypothetical protein